jgi:hypothetical protein
MKKWILNIFATTGLMLAFVLTVTPPLARSAACARPAPQERQEGFQDLRRAEQLLKEARTVLTAAPGEYGGHRDKPRWPLLAADIDSPTRPVIIG